MTVFRKHATRTMLQLVRFLPNAAKSSKYAILKNCCFLLNKFEFKLFFFQVMCAGNGTADACQSDSGGPLILQVVIIFILILLNLRNNFYLLFLLYYRSKNLDGTLRSNLLGIVSFGKECNHPEFPGVYTRVPYYMDWIKNHTDL